ncbi:hypothetical protein [Arthrobacter sp. UYEF36]|uniref:hypothetical protein n=1 Tax=Arthrobacter sp. UYEF36 TaxID=1756366 RepID=UPI0033945000
MTAAAAANPAAVLRRAALLAGLLAVIAGFLSMHILSGSHGSHTQASLPGSIQGSAAPHTAGPAAAKTAPSVTPAAATIGGTQVPPSCVCQGGCAEKPSAHIDCTPSPAGASLSAPQPGTTLLEAQPWSTAPADRLSGYAYRPGTPTPRDLSISRT